MKETKHYDVFVIGTGIAGQTAAKIHRSARAVVVACLTDGDIAVWLMTAFLDADTSVVEPHPDRRGRRKRALAWIRPRARRA